MKLLIIGAAGMIGRKLTARLARDGRLAGKTIDHAHLVDIVAPQPLKDAPFPVTLDAFDIAAPYVAPRLVAARPDVIFLLASVVSGEAEADFDKGYAINLGGTHALFEAIRREQALAGGAYRPRLIFTSSIAVYGAPFPDKIGDEFVAAPLDQLRNPEGDLRASARRLFAPRLLRRHWPAPADDLRASGAPNKAASGFFSGIIREPLNGKEAILPVGEEVRHWHASPRAAVEFLLRAAELDLSLLGVPPVAQPAGRERDRRRADRGAARHCRRKDGEAHPPSARRDDRPHRRRLGPRFRSGAGKKPRISRRRQFFCYNQCLY